MKNYVTNNQRIESMIKEMDIQLDTFRDMMDIRITEEFGLDTSIKAELKDMSIEDIESIKSESEVQIHIEKSMSSRPIDERRSLALQYISNLRSNYDNDSEWKDKEFIDYLKHVLKTIKESMNEINEFETKRNEIVDQTSNISKNWFEYVNSPEYKEKKQKRIADMKSELDAEENPDKKKRLSRTIDQLEASESLSFLFDRLEKSPNNESRVIKETYFNSQKSKIIMNKFKSRISKLGYNADIYKRFFNLEEMFLPDEYNDLNNIFLFHVMRFISHVDVHNDRDKMYASSILLKIYNLIYHKYDEQNHEDEFINIIKRLDDYFMPYIDEFKEKNITSPNHPIRKKRDEEYEQKIRLMLITNLQNEGIDVDTNLSTEELRSMLNDVLRKKENEESEDLSENEVNEESVINNTDTETTENKSEVVIYKDKYSYYYKKNDSDNNYTYYDTDNNIVEENVPEDDVLRLMTGGNLEKEIVELI